MLSSIVWNIGSLHPSARLCFYLFFGSGLLVFFFETPAFSNDGGTRSNIFGISPRAALSMSHHLS